ncbi:hypothetical protein E2C01_000249 [Portunus trituberculatus]|uniref:Uncharacterized protein n=1 Tax=Portunus trituberculatus TaxID=210409 RepID=A0A5B7CEF1_PORTR|nr:hypothetical protein [Portunus trituberculatus]
MCPEIIYVPNSRTSSRLPPLELLMDGRTYPNLITWGSPSTPPLHSTGRPCWGVLRQELVCGRPSLRHVDAVVMRQIACSPTLGEIY